MHGCMYCRSMYNFCVCSNFTYVCMWYVSMYDNIIIVCKFEYVWKFHVYCVYEGTLCTWACV